MDSDQGKLFIGGISWETTEEKLRDHFSKYGDVLQTVVMRDKISGKPRGFAFVAFSDPSIVDTVLLDEHIIDGRSVEAKRALSREDQQGSSRYGNAISGRNPASGGGMRTKKIFVGGLPASLTEEGFRQYFETYGPVTDVVVMYDQTTQRPRGFGFISFDSEEAVDRVLHKTFHDLHGKQVEVKRALPKDAAPPGTTRPMGSGGGYQGYGGAGGNSGGYDGRMESGRYMQNQNAGGGFPPYGSGYAATAYGYGPSNGMGYGGYGGYGGGNPAYGGPGSGSSGFGGPGAGGYGNIGLPNTGYPSGLGSGASRGSWTPQPTSGYGTAGYGTPGNWAGNTGGPSGAMPTGPGSAAQSPGAGVGYGNQAYGYGGYGGNDGSYPNSGGYASVGGRGGGSGGQSNVADGGDMQGSAAGYAGSGYADGNPGYANSSWRSEPSQGSGNYGNLQSNGPHGGQVGYGGGYGSAQGRPTQQQ